MKVATPPLNVAAPRVVLPSVNVTVPVGVPLAAVTVALKVTGCPAVEGFWEEVRAVVLAILLTVWLSTDEVLVANVGSPLYIAFM